jgi:4-hydroxy-tetrahydrodipicolinate synthase
VAKGRVPVVAGAGSNNTEEAVGLVQFAEEVGADAALVVTPYYNKPTQRGLYCPLRRGRQGDEAADHHLQHSAALGDRHVARDDGPIGARFFKNIVGVKDATGKVERVSEQRLTCGKDFIQLSGEDASALGFNAHGGVGCISVTSNVAPRLCAEFQAATLRNDKETALELQDRLMPLHKAIFAEAGLTGAKYALSPSWAGWRPRRALAAGHIEASTAEKIDAAMNAVGT